ARQGRGRRTGAAPARDDRDPHPAHPGDGGVRGPGRVGDRRAAARPHPGPDRGHGPGPPPGPDRAHPRRLRRGAPGPLALHHHRRVRRGGGACPAGHVRRAACGAAPRPGGAGARAHEGGGETGRHARLQGGRHRPAGRDHGDRGGRGRAERLAHGDRERGAAGPRPAAPAARARRPRQRGLHLRAPVPAAAVADGAGAPGDHARDLRRLRDRGEGPRAARAGRAARDAPDRPGGVPGGRPGTRRRPAARGAGPGRRAPRAPPRGGRAPGRALGGARGPLRGRVIGDTAGMEPRIPLLIDTDPGVDDALAMLMAFADPRHEVVGLTVGAGNVGLGHTVANALRLCEVAGRGGGPVYPGCDRPLLHPAPDAAYVHGADGFGDAGLPPAAQAAQAQHAAQAIIALSHRHAGRLLLATLGPLTNLALALRLDPTLPGRIARLVVMGGAASAHGNITPAAEFNVYFDPEAAHIVFSAFPRFDLCDWEATLAHGFLHGDVERWLAAPGPVAAFYEAVSRHTRRWSADA